MHFLTLKGHCTFQWYSAKSGFKWSFEKNIKLWLLKTNKGLMTPAWPLKQPWLCECFLRAGSGARNVMVNRTEPQIKATHSTHALRLQDESRKTPEHLDNEAINKKHLESPTWRVHKWDSEMSVIISLFHGGAWNIKGEYVYPEILNIQQKGNPHGIGWSRVHLPWPLLNREQHLGSKARGFKGTILSLCSPPFWEPNHWLSKHWRRPNPTRTRRRWVRWTAHN